MTTYQEEPWLRVSPELPRHFVASWREVEAQDMGGLVMDPDWAGYDALAAQGVLQLVTARKAGVLLGYHMSLLVPHLHYAGVLAAQTDTFYVRPGWRKGWLAYRLMQAVERAWQAKGVQLAFTMSKHGRRQEPFFLRLGWVPIEQMYVKRLGKE